MTFQEFKSSLQEQQPPPVAVLLQALWYEAKGDWEKSHELAQHVNTGDGSWVHAYLHRKEGDQFNAQYWYNRAKHNVPTSPLEKEWEFIVKELLGR